MTQSAPKSVVVLMRGEMLSFAQEDKGKIIRTVSTNLQIVIPCSLKHQVFTLTHYFVRFRGRLGEYMKINTLLAHCERL